MFIPMYVLFLKRIFTSECRIRARSATAPAARVVDLSTNLRFPGQLLEISFIKHLLKIVYLNTPYNAVITFPKWMLLSILFFCHICGKSVFIPCNWLSLMPKCVIL